MIHVGIGYDVHQLIEGRRLILGGVDIPHTKGLDGHSDADALMHAITDAVLGAIGEGDIGQFFPMQVEKAWTEMGGAAFPAKKQAQAEPVRLKGETLVATGN